MSEQSLVPILIAIISGIAGVALKSWVDRKFIKAKTDNVIGNTYQELLTEVKAEFSAIKLQYQELKDRHKKEIILKDNIIKGLRAENELIKKENALLAKVIESLKNAKTN